MSTLWCCPSRISSDDHAIAQLPRCPEGWFWRGCRCVWYGCNMRLSVSGQKRFLWTHKRVDLSPPPVVGLVLQVGVAEKFPQALGLQSLHPYLRVSKAGSMSHSHRGGWGRGQETCTTKLLAKLVFLRQILLNQPLLRLLRQP